MNRRLIINADDFGMCHDTNAAIMTLLEEGAVTSASLMMNCPWRQEAVEWIRSHPEADVGIHITHTSEWKHYRWGPLSEGADTLVDETGYFHIDTRTVIERADRKQLYDEAVAQIELAYRLGLDPTNIDNHMFSMIHVHDLMLDLCERYRLPYRYPRSRIPQIHPEAHDRFVKEAAERNIELIDHIAMLIVSPEEAKTDYAKALKEAAFKVIKNLKPGVTELVLHPSLGSEELLAITPDGIYRRYEYELLRNPEFQTLLRSEGIELTTWRELRDKQRAG